jgi:hypothetical protein
MLGGVQLRVAQHAEPAGVGLGGVGGGGPGDAQVGVNALAVECLGLQVVQAEGGIGVAAACRSQAPRSFLPSGARTPVCGTQSRQQRRQGQHAAAAAATAGLLTAVVVLGAHTLVPQG